MGQQFWRGKKKWNTDFVKKQQKQRRQGGGCSRRRTWSENNNNNNLWAPPPQNVSAEAQRWMFHRCGPQSGINSSQRSASITPPSSSSRHPASPPAASPASLTAGCSPLPSLSFVSSALPLRRRCSELAGLFQGPRSRVHHSPRPRSRPFRGGLETERDPVSTTAALEYTNNHVTVSQQEFLYICLMNILDYILDYCSVTTSREPQFNWGLFFFF